MLGVSRRRMTKELALSVFVLYLIGVSVYIAFYTRGVMKWPYVIGELKTAGTGPLGEPGQVAARIEYVYEIEGIEYAGRRLSMWTASGHVKKTIAKQLAKIEYVGKNRVKVYYNPRKPAKSYLVRESFLDFLGNW